MRRLISLISATIALVALGLVLYNATVIDRRPPEVSGVSLSAPAGDDRLAQTLTAIDLEFSEQVRASTVESRFRIEPYVAGAFSWDGSTAIFTPSAKLPPDTEFTVSVEPGFEDLVGNVATVGLEPWAFRTVGPPVVLGSTPGDGATGVGIDAASIVLVFDRLMDTASVEAAITLDPPADFSAAWSGETVRLVIDEDLRFGTTYTLRVGTEAADTGGNRLSTPYAMTFATVAAGLSVRDTIPAAGASGIGVRTPIAITFDAPIDPESARAAFRITPSVGGDLQVIRLADDLAPAGVDLDGANPDALVFVPDDPLAPHTTYTVTLEGTVARLDDPDAVAGGRTWTFTTGSPALTGQNQIAFLSVRSGVRNIWLMNPDGTNPRQLTTELVPVSGFDATGDGSRIAYSAGGVVRVIGIDGEIDEELTATETYEYAPVFTPDDGAVLLGRRGPDGEDLGYWLVPLSGTDGDARQVMAFGAPPIGSAALGGEGLVEGAGAPDWWPRAAFDLTGRWTLIVTPTAEAYLVDLDPDAEPSLPLEIDRAAGSGPTWSPRHGGFVLTAAPSDDGIEDVVAVVTTAGLATTIPGSDGAAGTIAVGPNGALAVGIRGGSGPLALAILEPGASVFRLLEPTAGRVDGWPSFAPDAGSLVVTRVTESQATTSTGIWSIDLESGEARQLTTDGAYARWLP